MGNRAGVVLYHNGAEVGIPFNAKEKVSTFKSAVRSLQYTGSATNIDDGLRILKDVLVPGAQKDLPILIVLLIDKSQQKTLDRYLRKSILNEIKSLGVTIFTVMVGTKRTEAIDEIVSNTDLVLSIQDMTVLQSPEFLLQLSNRLCSLGKMSLNLICLTIW